MKHDSIKTIGTYIGIYGVAIIAMILFLLLAAWIPNDAIEQNSKASADIFEEQNSLSHYMIGENRTTVIDDYADIIWLNIAYHFDHEQPFYSAMNAGYYMDGKVIDGYKSSVYEKKEANISYARYWHGSAAVLKLLLVFFQVKQIYLLNAFLLGGLFLVVASLLFKRKEYAMLIAFILSLFCVGIYTVPFCLEYTPNFMILFVLLILIMKVKPKQYFPLFFLAGMVTCYFDFLTTETITYTVPLLFLLIFGIKNHSFTNKKEIFTWIIKSGILWGIGYFITFFTKWLLALRVLGADSFFVAIGSAKHRMNAVTTGSMGRQILGSVGKPMMYLFPFSQADTYGQLLGYIFLIGVIGICLFYLYGMQNDKKVDHKQLLVVVILSAIPYVRYLVLNNHTYIHDYFVYRAQLIVILSWSYLFFSQLAIRRKRQK